MRVFLSGAALLAMVACSPTVPDSAAGVGFKDYETFTRDRAAREAELSGDALPAPSAVSSETLAEAPSGVESEAELIAAQTASELNSGEAPLEASPSNPPPEAVNAAGISQENDFADVSNLRTIQSDKERLAQNRAQYIVIEPKALPTRRGSGPNIVDYALRTTNPVGVQLYSRTNLFGESRYLRNCAKYPSPDRAQEAFLTRGGPKSDRLGLDPDGDGYACTWDPSPFRKVSGG